MRALCAYLRSLRYDPAKWREEKNSLYVSAASGASCQLHSFTYPISQCPCGGIHMYRFHLFSCPTGPHQSDFQFHSSLHRAFPEHLFHMRCDVAGHDRRLSLQWYLIAVPAPTDNAAQQAPTLEASISSRQCARSYQNLMEDRLAYYKDSPIN